MRQMNKLALLAMFAAFAVTAAVSAAVGFSAGVAKESNMYLTYPSFHSLVSRPTKPLQQDKEGVERYGLEANEYIDAGELYLNNALNDVYKIHAESEMALTEVNDFITEFNDFMQENNETDSGASGNRQYKR